MSDGRTWPRPKSLAIAVAYGTPRPEPRRIPIRHEPMTREVLAFNLYLAEPPAAFIEIRDEAIRPIEVIHGK